MPTEIGRKLLATGWLLLPLWSQADGLGDVNTAAACDAQLSSAQRARFQLATVGCSASALPRKAPLAVQADAVIASAGQPPQREALPARESAHLQLFARPGVVMARTAATAPVGALAPAVVSKGSAATPRVVRGGGTASTATVSRAVRLAPEIDAVARRHNIDPLLLHAIAYVESRHNPAATSRAGARGVMQVMPATGQRFGVDSAAALHDASTNLDVSATYLKTLQQRFGSNLTLVLAAYNAGEGAVERYGRKVPQYPETQDYVRQVLAQYRSLSATAKHSAASIDLSRPD